jgi:hypothetical protein
MPEIKCGNGVVIKYRLPNVIELFDLQDKCGWGKEGLSGYYRIARALENAEPFIESVSGKESWQDCLRDRSMADELSTLALNLLTDDLEDDEKKS